MNPVCIITALPAESRVFIDALRLHPVADHGWRMYGNDQCLLLQTGLGKLKAAAATGSLLHSRPDITAVINTGVAGGTPVTGTCALAHKITDAGSGASWYPHMPPRRLLPELQSTDVLTLDQPSHQYRAGVMFDMEAAGILSAAVTHLSTDAIQCIKVVSDNPDSPLSAFSKNEVTHLMQATVAPVLQLLDWYQQTDSALPGQDLVQELLDSICSTVHHTANDQHILKRLIQRQHSLTGQLAEAAELQKLTTARAIRHHLDATLSSTPLRYDVSST